MLFSSPDKLPTTPNYTILKSGLKNKDHNQEPELRVQKSLGSTTPERAPPPAAPFRIPRLFRLPLRTEDLEDRPKKPRTSRILQNLEKTSRSRRVAGGCPVSTCGSPLPNYYHCWMQPLAAL